MARLLLVDDDEALLTALENILSQAGHQVLAVASGEAVVERLRSSKGELPDLIITDLKMPDMTGLQLREIVRAFPVYGHIPFLIISASISEELARHIDTLEATTCLHKDEEVMRRAAAA